ncbi:alpha/beta hydrolase [Flavobacterium cupreum]|uniref:Alpha/beta hydrolase n=1 Tax=Flavobacterium cupreum TaxID=2133766 RepID=A0A434A554_9FLAO|nr:alpha/beta hydrolase [Flavobacterium cupreum]RUT69538.1 alpha/beta hydrolase [Flavobacterium cupreum]
MKANSKNVLLITGAFVSHTCWDEWIKYFGEKGYNALAPPWPFKDGTAKELRDRQPYDIGLAMLTLQQLIDYYAGIAKSFPEKPIIIGHSLGGMIAQILVNRDLAAAGIAVHSVPPLGVIPYEFTFLKSGWKVLGFFSSVKKTYLMSFPKFQYAFVNGLPLSVQKEAYEKYVIPESKTVARGGLTADAAVDFKKNHAPLLFVAGSKDQFLSPHLITRNFNKYRRNGSVIDYKEFKGTNHNVLLLDSWKENADYILCWIDAVLPDPKYTVGKVLSNTIY